MAEDVMVRMNGEDGTRNKAEPAGSIPRLTSRIAVDEGYLELSLFEMADAEELFAVLESNREYLGQWLPWMSDAPAIRDERKFILDSLEKFGRNEMASYAIRSEGRIVGGLGFAHIDWLNRSCSVGYWLDKNYTGRGIITRCCKALFETCFDDLMLHRISLHAAVENARSRAVAERLGMRPEGVSKETRILNGHFVDDAHYAITSPEWEGSGLI